MVDEAAWRHTVAQLPPYRTTVEVILLDYGRARSASGLASIQIAQTLLKSHSSLDHAVYLAAAVLERIIAEAAGSVMPDYDAYQSSNHAVRHALASRQKKVQEGKIEHDICISSLQHLHRIA